MRAEVVPFPGVDACIADLAVTDDGDIYVAGSVHTTPPDDLDAFVARLTPAGEVVWARQFGSDSNDEALALDLSAGGVVAGGYTNFELTGETSRGGRDFFLVSYSANGDLLALKQLGTSTRDALSDVVVSNGTVYATGISEGNVPGSEEVDSKEIAFVVRLDDELEPVWWWSSATVGTEPASFRNPVMIAAGEGLILTYKKFDNQATVLLKLDFNGNETWERRIGSLSDNEPKDMLFLSGRGIFVLGKTYGAFPGYQEPVCSGSVFSTISYSDTFLIKARDDGRSFKAVQFGGVGNDDGLSLTAVSGFLYVVYSRSGDSYMQGQVLYLAKFDLQKL